MNRETFINKDKTTLNTNFYLYLLNQENILTEFEKWLEHKYDLISKTFKENDFTNGYLEALDLCLYELKDLKEDKKWQ